MEDISLNEEVAGSGQAPGPTVLEVGEKRLPDLPDIAWLTRRYSGCCSSGLLSDF